MANAGNANQGYFNAQFQPNPSRYNQRGFGRFVVLVYVYKIFEDQDERRVPFLDNEIYTSYIFDEQGNLIDSAQHETANNWYYTWKYLDPDWDRFIHNQANTNLPILRFSDVFRGVLEAQRADEEAYIGIDMVRERAGTSPLPRNLSTEELRQRIRDERILEFYAEGQRYFDLKDGVH